MTAETNSNRHKGRYWEDQARLYLCRQGLKSLHHGFHSRFGEIDLVMKEKNTLVFVEVKYRSSTKYGDCLEAITATKQKKLVLTAKYFLQRNPWGYGLECRFDAVGITYCPTSKDVKFQWIKHAFEAFDF